MAKTYFTIENVGVTGGEEAAIEDWGIDDAEATFISQAEDEVTLSANGRRMDAAYLFPYKSTVRMRIGRTRAVDGTFSGGTNYFTGICAHPHVGASGKREFQSCSIVGPWWFLNERAFEQEYKEIESITLGVPTFKDPNPTKCRIFLNLKLGTYGQVTAEKITTGAQLEEILNWALKPFTDTATTAPFQIGTLGIAVDAPVDEVKNITCAEAARKMFRWSPDCVAWFDHSTSPPTFNVQRRADMTAFNLDIGTLKPTSVSITPRFDLQRPFVRIQYERTNTENGVSWPVTTEDVYPDPIPTGALNQFAGVPFVVDLRGFTLSTTPGVKITTTAIATTSNDWWLLNEPDYKAAIVAGRVQSVTIDPESVVIATEEGETNLNLPNQLIGGQPSDAVNANFQRLSISCKARVVYANGKVLPDKTFSFQITATDAVTGTYGGSSSIDEGDPVPVNLARDFYNAVAHVPYEGSLSFRESELGGTPSLGHKVNILGSDNEDWETMATLVQRKTESVKRRTTTVEIGTPPHLDANDLVALLRVSRNRDPQNPYSMRVGGTAGSSAGGSLRNHSARQNSSNADGNPEVVVASGSANPATEPDPYKLGAVKLDGPNKQLTLSGHYLDGAINLKIGVAGLDGTTQGRILECHQIETCETNDSGKVEKFTRMFVCSQRYKTAGQ